ncbi:type IV secretion protein [Parashewanella spongiae]|uniref:Type IV secretion protein n=1 Tax=Parashewanella spongiae TaxID=342950 RepID=A0A3A6TR67_9GAMM|nr:TrbC/VirB2 family protein [Parashewanella spongiae]MCL1079453.1 TrbC/VirB2 family protein [Parashewanella spongiae]RJY07565.1 type IV secretion protein [Parashewanella spongiae]
MRVSTIFSKSFAAPPSRCFNLKNVLPIIAFVLFLALIPDIAFANPITEGVDWVMDLLTNGIARSAAVIGIAILGYLAWFGRITGETCGKYIAGIVLVFGGTTIVDMIISAVK